MGKWKLAVLSFLNGKQVRLFMVVELSVLFVFINFLVGTIEARKLLYEPMKEMLSKEGYYFMENISLKIEQPEEYERLEAKIHSDLCGMEKFMIYNSAVMTEHSKTAMAMEIYAYPKEFIDLKLPLREGKWPKRDNEIVVAADSGYSKGDMIQCGNSTYKVTGVLTRSTYCLNMDSYLGNRDVTMFYKGRVYGDSDLSFSYLPLSWEAFFELKNDEMWGAYGSPVYYYSEEVEESVKEENRRLLSGCGDIHSLEDIRQVTEKQVKKDVLKYIPLYVAAIVVIVIGFVSGTMIRTSELEKVFKVFRICGADSRQCLGICLRQNVIMLGVSLLIACFFIGACRYLELFEDFPLLVDGWNIVFTLLGCAVFVLIDWLITYLMVGRKENLYD